MAIVIINPNSTVSMTDGMLAMARAAQPGTEFEGWTSHDGPAAIQGRDDGAHAVPPLLDLVRQASNEGADGIIIGCFDDTGLAEAVRLARCPVLGIGQAAAHVAAMRSRRFSVVTTLSVSVPILEENIHAYGFGHLLGRVRASEIPVLELERDPVRAAAQLAGEARLAIEEDDIDCLLLGCAGMASFAAALRNDLTVPVIDGVEAAARLSTCLAAS
mgnify:FL=1